MNIPEQPALKPGTDDEDEFEFNPVPIKSKSSAV